MRMELDNVVVHAFWTALVTYKAVSMHSCSLSSEPMLSITANNVRVS